MVGCSWLEVTAQMSDTRLQTSRVVRGDGGRGDGGGGGGGGVQKAFDDELCLKRFLSFSLPFLSVLLESGHLTSGRINQAHLKSEWACIKRFGPWLCSNPTKI